MERPILFNTAMVRAILDGSKTQTRRLMKPQPKWNPKHYSILEKEIPFKIGDILYVRETWCKGKVEYGEEPDGRNVPYISQCVGDDQFIPKEWAVRNDICIEDVVWKPSIHMPKEAARIFLRVKNVRVERLQDITVLDAINEGCCGTACDHSNANPELGCTDCYNTGWLERPEIEFALLWDTTVKKDDQPIYGWDANPWVWVIEFERCKPPKMDGGESQ